MSSSIPGWFPSAIVARLRPDPDPLVRRLERQRLTVAEDTWTDPLWPKHTVFLDVQDLTCFLIRLRELLREEGLPGTRYGWDRRGLFAIVFATAEHATQFRMRLPGVLGEHGSDG